MTMFHHHHSHNKPRNPIGVIVRIIVGIVVASAFALLFGYFVKIMWNWLMPAIFPALPVITFWQAVVLILLARVLFGGIPRPGTHQPPWQRRDVPPHDMCAPKDVHHYRTFWEEEGKEAFDAYLTRVREREAARTTDEERSE